VVTPALTAALDSIDADVRAGNRRLLLRVERGNEVLEGELDRRLDDGVSMLVGGSLVVIPFAELQRLWVAVVRMRRMRLYLATSVIIGAAVAIASTRLTQSSMLPGVLLGIASTLAVLLAAWFPPARTWLVAWQLRYDADA
jgi:hypothetical protein